MTLGFVGNVLPLRAGLLTCRRSVRLCGSEPMGFPLQGSHQRDGVAGAHSNFPFKEATNVLPLWGPHISPSHKLDGVSGLIPLLIPCLWLGIFITSRHRWAEAPRCPRAAAPPATPSLAPRDSLAGLRLAATADHPSTPKEPRRK